MTDHSPEAIEAYPYLKSGPEYLNQIDALRDAFDRGLAARPVLVVGGREKRRAIEAWREADTDQQILKAGNDMRDLLAEEIASGLVQTSRDDEATEDVQVCSECGRRFSLPHQFKAHAEAHTARPAPAAPEAGESITVRDPDSPSGWSTYSTRPAPVSREAVIREPMSAEDKAEFDRWLASYRREVLEEAAQIAENTPVTSWTDSPTRVRSATAAAIRAAATPTKSEDHNA